MAKNQKIVEENKAGWVKDEEDYEDDADVVKLDVGESIEGILVEIKESSIFGKIYKLKVKDDERYKIVCGTTVLNTKMGNKQTGDEVLIERVEDKKNQTGRTYQDYITYSREE